MQEIKLTTRNIEYLQGITRIMFDNKHKEPVRAWQIATYLERDAYSQQKTNATGFKRMTARLEKAGLIEVIRKENLNDWEINITHKGRGSIAGKPIKLAPIHTTDIIEKKSVVLFETPIGNVTIDLD